MNGQINITFVIEYEQDDACKWEEKEKAEMLAEIIQPRFDLMPYNGITITDATAFYQDEEVCNY